MRYYGDPVLRKAAEPILEITEEIREICHNMVKTMLIRWIGLAAPQVGYLLRIFVSNVDYEVKKGNCTSVSQKSTSTLP